MIVLALFSATTAEAGWLGQRGTVYPVAERSWLDEMRETAASVRLTPPTEKELGAMMNAKASAIMTPLPKADKSGYRLVDITWTAPKDYLPTAKGTVYPAGFRFNPAAYATYPLTIAVFDAGDEKQREWLWDLYRKDRMLKIFISGGDWLETEMWLARRIRDERVAAGEKDDGKLTAPPLYPLSRPAVDRFQLRAVPCTVRQEGELMRVDEYTTEGYQ